MIDIKEKNNVQGVKLVQRFVHKNALKKEYNNLILVDFVCHGVGSQELFDKDIEWWAKKGKKFKF